MENFPRPVRRDDERFELPAGFRFHPTDEELIICYLAEKVLDSSFTAIAIGEADLNKCEPWDLPWMAKWGEDEWYFFSVRDRKYPLGQRANRATEAGYWKATGKDKEIFREKTVIGMKKTLVFYKGRAPQGERTNWVMHEYRLQAHANGFPTNIQPQNLKSEWVLCRVFQKKNNGGEKLNIPPPPPSSSSLHHLSPLTDASPLTTSTTPDTATAQAEFGDQSSLDGVIVDVDISESTPLIFPSSSSFSNPTNSYSYQSTSAPPLMVPLPQLVNPQYPDGLLSQDQILMSMLMENNDGYSNTMRPSLKAYDQTQFSGDTQFLGSDKNAVSSTQYNNNVGNMNMLQSPTTSFAQNPEYSSVSAGNDLDFGTFWNF